MLKILSLGSCLIGLAVSVAQAQSQDPVSLGYFHKLNGDIDGGGDASVDRWNIRGGVVVHQTDDLFAVLTASYSVDDYNFDSTFQPWGTVRQATAGAVIKWKLNEKWTLGAVPKIGLSAEHGADLNDSINWSIVTSFDYKFNDSLTIGPGFSYVNQLEDSDSLFPILSIKWQINDQWSLQTGPSEGASSGANVYLSYQASDRLQYSAGAFYHESRFRLSERSSFTPNGVGEESFIGAYGIVKVKLRDNLSCSLIAGYTFANEYNVDNASGNSITQREADATPFTGIRLSYEF